MKTIESLRKKIDEVDHQLISFLAVRRDLVKKIGSAKAKKNMSPLDRARFQEVLRDRITKGHALGLPKEFIKNIWNVIHSYSVKEEKNIVKKENK